MHVGRFAWKMFLWFVWLTMSALTLSSYFSNSLAGFDFEWDDPNGVYTRYYRLRWSNGCVFTGFRDQIFFEKSHELDWFDPGGGYLGQPVPIVRNSWPRKLGFWYVDRPANDPYFLSGKDTAWVQSYWLGVPAWLVLLLLWPRSLLRLFRRRTASSPA